MGTDSSDDNPSERNSSKSKAAAIVVAETTGTHQPQQPGAGVLAKPQKTATAPTDLPLNWTQLGPATTGDQLPIRYPNDVAEISIDDLDLCIVGTAGQKITFMGNDLYRSLHPDLSSLILRSHLIRKMDGLQGLTKLELLELYDNQIEELECLADAGHDGAPGHTLRVLDMSYNVIRAMDPVASCPNLQELYLANNKIKTMAGLGGLTKLRKLDLGANRIREMDAEELSGLVSLEELWLGKNKIESIQGLEKLTKLRRLDVQSNRLTRVIGLESQRETLEELFLAHNGLADDGMDGLKIAFTKLSVLDLGRNRLTSLRHFAHLVSLEELWVSGNLIADFDEVKPLATLTNLETIYLEYNPVQDANPMYRRQLMDMLAPSLKQIDATPIGRQVVAAVETPEERNRRLQRLVVERAQKQQEAEEAKSEST